MGVTATAPAAQQISVNLADDTGPVFHGASGALYGLSENGVPGARLNAGLNIITFGNPTAYAPNIDQITVAPAHSRVMPRASRSRRSAIPTIIRDNAGLAWSAPIPGQTSGTVLTPVSEPPSAMACGRRHRIDQSLRAGRRAWPRVASG